MRALAKDILDTDVSGYGENLHMVTFKSEVLVCTLFLFLCVMCVLFVYIRSRLPNPLFTDYEYKHIPTLRRPLNSIKSLNL